MIDKGALVKALSDAIEYGIDLKDEPIETRVTLLKDIRNYINMNTHLNAHFYNRKITIESVFFHPLLSVEFEKSVIQCIPITDEGWIDAMFEVLKYFYTKEEQKKEKLEKQKEQDDKEFDWI